jgi:hypothetical protein
MNTFAIKRPPANIDRKKQGDQKIGKKIAQILDIEAKTIVPNQKRLNYIHQS